MLSEKVCVRCYGTLKPMKGAAMIMLTQSGMTYDYRDGLKAKVWLCGKCGLLQWFTLPDEEEEVDG